MEQIAFEQLAAWEQNLVQQAQSATQTAYAPYSHFQVGAAVLLQDGTIIRGSNQENKAYGSCVCAERVALLYATANYAQNPPIAIAIAAQTNGSFTEQPVTPCGECRQVLAEMQERFATPIRVLMYGSSTCLVAPNIQALLPTAF